MSIKQHELNILNNALEKAVGLSERLTNWLQASITSIQGELDAEAAAGFKQDNQVGSDTVYDQFPTTAPAAPVDLDITAPVVPFTTIEIAPALTTEPVPIETAPSDPVTVPVLSTTDADQEGAATLAAGAPVDVPPSV